MAIDPLVGHLTAPYKLKAFGYDYSESTLALWNSRKEGKHGHLIGNESEWRRNLINKKSPVMACAGKNSYQMKVKFSIKLGHATYALGLNHVLRCNLEKSNLRLQSPGV